ncbi:hypothetical protein CR513_53203, partial [Mucuna pruriens]
MRGLIKSFWLEAVNWSLHILNKSPTLAIQNMTSKGMEWSPTTYAHVTDEKRKKLNEKYEKYTFLGVSDHSKAYKLYNPRSKEDYCDNLTFDEAV